MNSDNSSYRKRSAENRPMQSLANAYIFATSEGGFAVRVKLCTVKTYDNNKAKVDYCMISIYSVVTRQMALPKPKYS